MCLKEWITTACSECESPTLILFSFTHPDPVPGWKLCHVYYMKCTACNRLYIGEYSEGRTSGKCWSMMPIFKVHQLEGFIGEAYWRYYSEPVEEIAEECI